VRAAIVVLIAVATAGCAAGGMRTVEAADVSPALAGEEVPFERLRLAWPETGVERYDRFFREAAALQGAIVLAEEAARGRGDVARLLPIVAGLQARAEAALAEGEALLPNARTDFAHDEGKAMMIEPALHDALGQVRDAAARAPELLRTLRAAASTANATGRRARSAGSDQAPESSRPEVPPESFRGEP
jgi:hypothetical protein